MSLREEDLNILHSETWTEYMKNKKLLSWILFFCFLCCILFTAYLCSLTERGCSVVADTKAEVV